MVPAPSTTTRTFCPGVPGFFCSKKHWPKHNLSSKRKNVLLLPTILRLSKSHHMLFSSCRNRCRPAYSDFPSDIPGRHTHHHHQRWKLPFNTQISLLQQEMNQSKNLSSVLWKALIPVSLSQKGLEWARSTSTSLITVSWGYNSLLQFTFILIKSDVFASSPSSPRFLCF